MSMVGMRKAAAFLAGLHAADRRWLLGQLPLASARQLEPLVREVEPLLKAMPAPDAFWDEPASEGLIEVPAPDALVRALDTLDEAWAARMIAAAAPDHAGIYLAACAHPRAMGIRHELDALPGKLPGALARCLGEALAGMADGSEASQP
jgi:hypothetical protein